MLKVLFRNILLMLIVVLLDQVFKNISLTYFTVHRNFGVFLGLFSDAPISFRVVTLATFSGFIFCIYILLLYLLPSRTNFLKYTLSLIMGGIFGNIFDRLYRGFTIDFIPTPIPEMNAFFNVADIFLWCGCFYFIFAIFYYEKIIWHPDNSRNNYLINPKEQLRLAFKFFLISVLTSLLLGLFSFTFIKSFLGPKQVILTDFIITYTVLSSLFSILVFLIGIIISHKSAGPLFAFELYVEKLINGSTEKLTLRDGDNYKHLEEVANKLRKFINK